jgi:hypothetical protein
LTGVRRNRTLPSRIELPDQFGADDLHLEFHARIERGEAAERRRQRAAGDLLDHTEAPCRTAAAPLEEGAHGRAKTNVSLTRTCEPTGSGPVPAAENIQRESSPVVYCGSDQQISEGFAIALQIMGRDTSFPRVGIVLATNAPNTEDD